MKRMLFVCIAAGFVLSLWTSWAIAQDYVGSSRCMTCHNSVNPNTGYNIWEEYMKTGHPYKLNAVSGGSPMYPDNTSPGVPAPPPGTDWSEFVYVIGGYGWKARFIKADGKIFTTTEEAQYNLETQGWVAYHYQEDKAYNESCFQCHTTGNSPDGSWNAQTADLGTFSEPGVRCEGCHGPGSDHVANPSGVKLPNQGRDLTHERCGDCHQRGGRTNAIPASGGYIKHHEQFNEMMASKHGTGLLCGTCHDTHIAGRYPEAAGEGLKAITKECSSCHPDHKIYVNGMEKNIDCIDCHMSMASKSAVGKQKGNGWEGDVKTHIFKINTDAVTKDAMFTEDGSAVALDNDGLAAVTLDFACLGCHQSKDVTWASTYAKDIHTNGIRTMPDYVGSQRCKTCHDNVNANTGYNIYEEYMKTGHPYKLNAVNGGPPTFPANTSPGVPAPPPGTEWSEFVYVIGGYGWKARFIKSDGKIFTATEEAQYNLETKGWVAYHYQEDKAYNQGCFTCHTTGGVQEGSWNAQTAGLGNFSEPGVRCEGCHGPGGDHVSSPSTVKLPNQGRDLTHERCGDCHQRGGRTNAIPASGGYIKHHEQFNEMMASKHGTGLICGTCHDTHIAGRYPGAAGEGLKAITKECSTCHADRAITINGEVKNIDCIDCHMPMASKSAVGKQKGNGWEGDVKTHIFKINTDAVTKDAMFTEDGSAVALDNDGMAAVTLDFACLACHQSKDVTWASSYAKNIHDGITTDVDPMAASLAHFALEQNYPNPFNPETSIRYIVPRFAHVQIDILDAYGRVLETIVNQPREAGSYTANFNGDNHVSGVYFYRMTAGDVTLVRKMILMK